MKNTAVRKLAEIHHTNYPQWTESRIAMTSYDSVDEQYPSCSSSESVNLGMH